MKEKRKKILKYGGLFVLLVCTVIGGYGILRAPASDREELEQELKRNEQALADEETLADEEMPADEEPNEDSASGASVTTRPQTSKAAAASGAAAGQTVPETETERSISVIGDSVFLGAAPAFKKLYKNAVIDAKISRQVYHGIDVAKKLEKKHKLGETVIISLGTNCNFNPATGQELIDYLGAERDIYWINVYGKKLDIQRQVNDTIQKLAEKNRNVHVIAWADEGRKHPDWFYQDGVHLNLKGQSGFAKFVQKALG